ncbi:hypothetical protein QFC21_005249 [Naganishia friedmannii]|uniref:Uncharacterized protein n=1 Tax=Naganishia friedmannii TaxID=89922 RepID=A0ACC2VAV5_9TREE|nr:hypothetical protein QFC21_005249 [Naganishia friedmannii]
MSSSSPTNALITSVLTAALLGYAGFHAYRFDGGKCLLWSKDHHVRTAMVWAQVASAASYCVWSLGMTLMKWKAGYIQLPIYGIIPVPYQLWSPQQLRYNNIYVAFLCGAFCLYDAVNLEEWLYWIYVVRAVRTKSRQNQDIVGANTATVHYPFHGKPSSTNNSSSTTSFVPTADPKPRTSILGKRAARKTAKWISSNVFIVWVVLSLAQTVVHFMTAFLDGPDVEQQSIRLYLTEGLFNSLTAILSIILAWQFPGFIRLVKETGASSEVISKLQFYHELNKWRILFRVMFSLCTCILGMDALSRRRIVNVNSLAADLLFQVTVLSFFFASICSWMLYLPVQWNKTTFGYGKEAGRLRPQFRRYTPAANRGRRAGLKLRPTEAAAAKALASPTSFCSPHTEAYPNPVSADYEDAAQRRMMMSQHSEQHRTLIDLLRERGTIGHDERLPEDDIFDDQAEAEAYGVGDFHIRSSRNNKDSDTIGYVGTGQRHARREIDAEDDAFATALGEPLYLQAQLPAGVEPVYGARETVERGPVRNDLLPLVVSVAISVVRAIQK